MQPKLSIIVPVYKVEPFLRQCLDSLVNQTMKNIEIICIDDGSPDNCGAICDEYAKIKKGGVIFKAVHKQNAGLLNAWNDGMQLAEGEYLTFVDSDDWVDIDYYERMFAAIGDRRPDVFCSGGRYEEKAGKTIIRKMIEQPFYYSDNENRAELLARVLVDWPSKKEGTLCFFGYAWDKIYKTEFIKEKIIGWNKRMNYGPWPDVMLELNVFSKADQIGGCLEIGNHYRLGVAGGATRRYWTNMPEICCNWAEDAYNTIKSTSAYGEEILNDAFLSMRQMMFISCIRQYFIHSHNKDSYLKKAKEFNEFKNDIYFKEALKCKSRFETKGTRIKLTVYRLSDLWVVNLIHKLRALIK